MSQVKFYTGSDISNAEGQAGSIYITEGASYPRMYIGANKTPIGQQVDRLAIGSKITSVPEYSIVGGTNDENLISSIVGGKAALSLLKNIKGLTIEIPTTDKKGTISIGTSTKVNTSGSNSIGSLNTAGVMGFYWSSIDFTNKKITLSTSQTEAEWNLPDGVTFDWSAGSPGVLGLGKTEGDTISIVNNTRYVACAKITAIDKTNHTITVDNLPFTAISTSASTRPDDYTICAAYYTEISDNNGIWRSRSGSVEIGYVTTVLGGCNLSSGDMTFVTGFGNWGAGRCSATFGANNISGYFGITGGYKNRNVGNSALVVGRNNQCGSTDSSIIGGWDHVISDPSGGNIVGGAKNTISANAFHSIISGSGNGVDGNHNNISGQNNNVTTCFSIIGGQNNQIQGDNSLVTGHLNNISVTRSLVVGSQNSGTIQDTLVAGAHITVNTSTNCIIGGSDHEVSGNCSIIGGYQNTAQSAASLTVGSNNKVVSTAGNCIIGGSDHEVSGGNCIIGGTDHTISETSSKSIVSGFNNTSEGESSIVSGYKNTNVGINSLVVGANNYTTNHADLQSGYSVIGGYGNMFDGVNSLIVGQYQQLANDILHQNSIVCGYGHQGRAPYTLANSIVAGTNNDVGATNSIVSGKNNYCTNSECFVSGEGNRTVATYQTLLGRYSNPTTATLFAIGNGASTNATKNAFEVRDNGSVVATSYDTTNPWETVNVDEIVQYPGALYEIQVVSTSVGGEYGTTVFMDLQTFTSPVTQQFTIPVYNSATTKREPTTFILLAIPASVSENLWVIQLWDKDMSNRLQNQEWLGFSMRRWSSYSV